MAKESILVVEDEEIMRESLIAWFTEEGHAVDGAADGDRALAEHRIENYDALIIDLKLPGRDGLDVLTEVQQRNPSARVVIVTAYPSYETAVEAMRRGAVDYLPKPFDLDRLAATLDAASQPAEIGVPPLEELPLAEENVTPCIWTQAGVVSDRMCSLGYRCNAGCRFHTAMLSADKYRDDPRIEPYLERLTYLSGMQQCRYCMSGEVSSRSCPTLYRCEECELAQAFQDAVDRQLAIRTENKRRRRAAAERRRAERARAAGPGTVH